MEDAAFSSVGRALMELGNHLGESFALDESGACYFTWNGRVPLAILAHPNGEATVGMSIAEKMEIHEELRDLLLEYNWMGDRTDGGTLAVQKSTGNIVLSFRLPASEVSGPKLSEWFDRALRTGLRLQDELIAYHATKASPISAPTFALGQLA